MIFKLCGAYLYCQTYQRINTTLFDFAIYQSKITTFDSTQTLNRTFVSLSSIIDLFSDLELLDCADDTEAVAEMDNYRFLGTILLDFNTYLYIFSPSWHTLANLEWRRIINWWKTRGSSKNTLKWVKHAD